VVFSFDTTAGSATEVLAESLDTDLLPHVELVADGSGAHVEPVWAEWVQLLVACSLHGHGPVGDLELVNLLQMLSENLDELMRRYVFHSVYVFVE